MRKKNEMLENIDLDLHWDFRDRFAKTNIKDFWMNAKEVDLGGDRILQPSREELILYLALTAITNSDFVDLRYIYDIHRLISEFAEGINWGAVVSKSRQAGLDKALFFVLDLSADLFGTAIAKEVLGAVKPPYIKEKLLKLWVNKTNVLTSKQKIASSVIWRYFVNTFLYSKTDAINRKVIIKTNAMLNNCSLGEWI